MKAAVRKDRTDNELIKEIQAQYIEYRKGGSWLCVCGNVIPHVDKQQPGQGLIVKVKCDKCKENAEHFLSVYDHDFDSLEFDELFERYEAQIEHSCSRMVIEDPDDVFCDQMHRFTISVYTYRINPECTFKTYMWSNIRKRMEDFERKNSRACKSNPVQCQLCGRYVGAITRNHLMGNKAKPMKDFPGHKVLHEKVIRAITYEKFAALGDEVESQSYVWQGNGSYSRKQSQVLRSMLVDAYKELFPKYPISNINISIHDCDPKTNIEYIHMVADGREHESIGSGYFITSEGHFITEDEISNPKYDEVREALLFIPAEESKKIKDLCKEFSSRISGVLHQKLEKDKERQTFDRTKNREGLEQFLTDILPYVMRGYDKDQIHTILKVNPEEVGFWLKKMKRSKELKKLLKLR